MSLNVNNINYNDFKNICRACMLNCDIKFTPTNEMSDVFYKLTNIHFETNENLPQQICLQCFDKIIDIQEFALRCKQTHTTLKECLNNLEKIGSSNQQNENIENSNDLQTILPNTVTIVKHEVEDIDDNSLNLTDPIEIKEEMIEETNEIPEESEINYDQSTNCFADALLIPNTFKKVKNPKGKIVKKGQRVMAYNVYVKRKNEGLSKTEAVKLAAEDVGISSKLVFKIVGEMESTGTLKSPPQNRKREDMFSKLSEQEKEAVKHTVHSFFEQNEIPTVDKVLKRIEENDLIPRMSRSTLSKVLKKLGFVWEKRGLLMANN